MVGEVHVAQNRIFLAFDFVPKGFDLQCSRDLDLGATVGVLYSEHPSAERWDLEFGSNTTEKVQVPPFRRRLFEL